MSSTTSILLLFYSISLIFVNIVGAVDIVFGLSSDGRTMMVSFTDIDNEERHTIFDSDHPGSTITLKRPTTSHSDEVITFQPSPACTEKTTRRCWRESGKAISNDDLKREIDIKSKHPDYQIYIGSYQVKRDHVKPEEEHVPKSKKKTHRSRKNAVVIHEDEPSKKEGKSAAKPKRLELPEPHERARSNAVLTHPKGWSDDVSSHINMEWDKQGRSIVKWINLVGKKQAREFNSKTDRTIFIKVPHHGKPTIFALESEVKPYFIKKGMRWQLFIVKEEDHVFGWNILHPHRFNNVEAKAVLQDALRKGHTIWIYDNGKVQQVQSLHPSERVQQDLDADVLELRKGKRYPFKRLTPSGATLKTRKFVEAKAKSGYIDNYYGYDGYDDDEKNNDYGYMIYIEALRNYKNAKKQLKFAQRLLNE